jgi:hypothetical protein
MNVIELRAIKPLPSGKNDTYVGYYDDPEILAEHAKRLNDDGYHIYSPFNPIKPGAVTQLNQPPSRRRAVRGHNIERRVRLPYDYDVDRPKGQAASDSELRVARAVVQKRVNFWREHGVAPLVKHSGNGYQLEVPIDLPNDAAAELLVKKVLQVHKAEDDTPGVHLDCWKDASRIFRVPGYINWKGDGSAERPHRTVKLLNESSGIATREMLEAFAKDWTKLPASSGTARGKVEADQDALAVLKAAYLRSGRVWSALKAARKQNLKLNGDHSTITAFANFLNNSWEEDRENYDGIVRVLETIWDECGTSSDGGRTPTEVEDIVTHAFAKDRKPCVIFDSLGPADPPYVRPAFVWSSRKNIPPPDQWYSDNPKWQQKGPIWVFSTEEEYAVFKLRVEQTPAWAYAAERKDPDGWSELPADYEAWKASQPSTENGFRFPKVPGKVFDYMLLPRHSAFDGWCGRGRTHIIAGSSGSGKTTLMVPVLLGQWEKKNFFGHVGAGLRPLILFADRGKFSNEETLLRLGLTDSSLPIEHLGDGLDDSAIAEILRLIEAQNPLPEVVFIEGADTVVSKAGDGAVVSRFIRGIERIAEHYHISFILSVGAPKAKPKDQHTLVRDRVFGSEKWARKSDMILSLSAPGDGTSQHRHLIVQYRNAPDEKFELEFAEGRLVEREPPMKGMDALEAWMCGQDWFTRKHAMAAMEDYASMSKATVNRRIAQMFQEGKLETRPSKDRKVEELRLKRDPQTTEQCEMNVVMEGTF